MSLMFMLFALSGAVLVLGGGSYALRRLLAGDGERVPVAEGPGPVPQVESVAQVGGYVPAPREPGGLPPALCAGVRELVAVGRTAEAVGMVREYAHVDEDRARRIVEGLGVDGGVRES
nr:hypothetical protein [Nocardiopsis sp. ATB16-24]